MALQSHIQQLELKHQELEGRLMEMVRTPSASDLEIADLKRQKLHVKDKLVELKKGSGLN